MLEGVVFSGGEPLLQPDAPETVVRHAPDGLVDRFPEEGATWEHCTHEVFLEPSGSARIAVTV